MRIRFWIAVVAVALSASGAAAQETTGSITGTVRDNQGLAIPGATITVTGAQGARTYTTDDQGQFRAPFLTPGDYTVKVELAGFRPLVHPAVVVRLGQVVDLPLALDVGGVAEAVTVQASSPVVDTTSTTVGANLDSETLRRVPVGRRFSDTLYLAAGVSSSGSLGSANPSVSGGSGLENQYVVDGVNITNAGYGALGSYSIYHGSLGNGVNFDFIKEVQVKTAGYEAEYGQSTGGVVNVVTKSGGNQLRGSLFGYTRPDGANSEWKQLQTDNGAVNTRGIEINDVGVEVGGRVVPDRVFFFGAVNPQWDRRTMVAPAGFPLESLGEVVRERNIVSYAAKGTWQMSSRHRLDVSAFGDPAEGLMGPQRLTSLTRTDTAGFSELKYGGHNQIGRYDAIVKPNWLLEASVARAKNTLEETPFVNSWLVTDRTVTPNVRTGGIGFYEVGNDGTNLQFQAKSTHIAGTHQVRWGGLYEDIAYDNVIQRTGPTITLPNGQASVTGAQVEIRSDPTLGRFYRVVRANTSNVRNTTARYFNAFVQDTWRPSSRLTVRAGVRYEQQTLVGTLVDDFTLDGNWAPRIGATYDVTGNGKSKLFANWGRFYAKIPNDLAARALSADAGVTRADYYDAALTRPIPEGVEVGGVTNHYQESGVHPSLIDPDVRSTYLDETLVGFEYELLPHTNVGVRWVRKRFGRVLEDVSPYPLVACDVGISAACSVDYTLTNPSPTTPTLGGEGLPAGAAAFEDPIHDYDAIEITADRRFAGNWALQASYRWSRLYGTFEGFYRDDNGQSDPGITSLYDFPTNDPTYTSIGGQFGYRGDIRYLGALGAGPLPLDRPHQVKLFGSYTTGFGLNLGGGVFLSSGKALTPFAANPSYDSGGEIPEAPRGSGIQTVEGFKKRAPFEHDTSVHADYGLKFGTRRLVLLADVFNLFNNQNAFDYDNWTEVGFGAPDPDYGQPILAGGVEPQYKAPRQIRFGVRFEF